MKVISESTPSVRMQVQLQVSFEVDSSVPAVSLLSVINHTAKTVIILVYVLSCVLSTHNKRILYCIVLQFQIRTANWLKEQRHMVQLIAALNRILVKMTCPPRGKKWRVLRDTRLLSHACWNTGLVAIKAVRAVNPLKHNSSNCYTFP